MAVQTRKKKNQTYIVLSRTTFKKKKNVTKNMQLACITNGAELLGVHITLTIMPLVENPIATQPCALPSSTKSRKLESSPLVAMVTE